MTRDTHLNALNLSFSSGSLSGLYHFRLTFCIVRVLIIVIILLSPFLSPEKGDQGLESAEYTSP
jgi:hypothetical protein